MKKIVLFSVFALVSSYNSVYCTPLYYNPYPSYQSEESEKNIKDSITFSSAYFESQYTNKQLANFGLELIRGTARLEDFIINNFDSEKKKRYTKWFARAMDILFIQNSFNAAYHEIGHGLRARAYGTDFQLTFCNEHGKFKKDQNFFKFFVKTIFNHSRPCCCHLPIDGELYAKTPKDEAYLVINEGGMNNETYMAERITRDFHNRDRLTFSESYAYFFDKLSPVAYVLSEKVRAKIKGSNDVGADPINIEKKYTTLGISATQNHIALSGLVSVLFSGTTWSIMRSVFSDKYVTPISFYNFQAPDLFSYITSKGISYKLISAYKCNDILKFLFGAEHVLHGKSTTEVHLGADINFYNANLQFVTSFGNGFNAEAVCSIPVINNHLSINVEVGTYNCKSLLGERHATTLKDKKRSNDLAVSISYKY